jgi:putative ABC transport system substrate-binding protein
VKARTTFVFVGLVLVLMLCVVLSPAQAEQPGKVARIGLFHVGLDHDPPGLVPLRESLKRLGYEEGKNIQLDYRNQADEETAHGTARAFVRERVDLIVAFENQAIRAAQTATSKIPVVFAHVSDPVAAGFVKSLARPGSNLTGVADYVGELQDKRVQILGEMVRLRRLLVLTDPTDPATARLMTGLTRVAPQLKVELVERRATTETDLTKVFASLKKGEVDGMVIISPKLLTNFPSLILRLGLEHQIPLAYHRKALVEQGALFSYGPNFLEVGEALATYIDRILKGAKPGDLPVQQAGRLELVINLKTAKTLGLTIPPSLLLRADQVIE